MLGRPLGMGRARSMDKAEFDRVADEYVAMHRRSIAASGEDPAFFARYKVEDAAREARAAGLEVRAALDFGSGIGNSLPHFAAQWPQARITGADVSGRSLALSRSRFPQLRAEHVEIEGGVLPFEAQSFDLCFSACVFHHIPQQEHGHWLAELRRVARPGGMLMLFEHNPLNPLTVAAVNDCPFDENAVLLRAGELQRRVMAAGWAQASVVYRLFFPRALAFARPAERLLRRLPLGAQYFVRARRAD